MAGKIVCVVAHGLRKNHAGVLLAKQLGGEVVSADSMQIYRGMTIGTAAPTPEEMDGVPHHMIAVADRRSSGPPPGMPRRRSRWWMTFLPGERCPFWWAERGCGWTPWCGAMALRPARAGGEVRRELEEQLRREGIAPLLEQLRQVDPESAARLHPSDEKRILRALEVYRETGMTITAHNEATKALPPRYDAVWIGLQFADREDMKALIDRRVDLMVEAGLLEEVRQLLSADCPGTPPPSRPSATRSFWRWRRERPRRNRPSRK